jgi:uncharacterized membrane protein
MPPAAPPPSGPPPANYGGGGGFAPPPAQPYGGAGGGSMPQLDVGAALSYGWKKYTENLGQFIILMIAVFVASVVLGIIRGILTPDSTGFLAFIWSALLGVTYYVISSIIQAGVLRAGLGVTKGQAPSVSQLTETSNIANYILTVILVGLGLFIGLILCVIPGIIWFFLTAYAPIVALDKGVGPVDAIMTSINWVKERPGPVLGILIVSYLIYLVGICFFCIGLLVTAPVALVAIIYSYRALNNEPVAP